MGKSAASTAKTVRQGAHKKSVAVRTKVHFYRPKTQKTASKPQYTKRAIAKGRKLDQWQIIKHPLATESAMQKIEQRTLVLIVDVRANKRQIKQAVKARYQVDAEKVNTLIRPDGSKKAYVKLTPEHDALEVANRIRLI